MRLIDADALRESVLKWLPHDPCGVEENEHPYETDICVSMLMEIEDAPTIEPEKRTEERTETHACDYISRQAAISEIMEDLEDRSLHDDPATPEDYAEGYDEGIRNAAAIVLQMPSVQPEIIRCKDCKYCDRGIDEDGNPFLKCLGWAYGGTQEEDFCSHAERRTDG